MTFNLFLFGAYNDKATVKLPTFNVRILSFVLLIHDLPHGFGFNNRTDVL